MALDETVGFLGFGNMGGAIARGLLAMGTLPAPALNAYDVAESRLAEARRLGITVVDSPQALAALSTTLILAVKPQTMTDALGQIPPGVLAGKRVISIAAGISIATLQRFVSDGARIVRVMPNTPALVGAGAAAIALGPACDARDAEVAQAIFAAVGSVELVDEDDLDAVTALSGSGPAYFFYVVECLIRAAVDEGLDEVQAARLAHQTLYGAGKLLAESGETAGTLRERVTSKGGTTAAALAAFQNHGLAAVIHAGVNAAAARSDRKSVVRERVCR